MANFPIAQYHYNLFLIQSCIYEKVLSLCKKEQFTIVCDDAFAEIKTSFTIYETLYDYISTDGENNCLTEEEINQLLSVIKRLCGCNIKLLNI